VRDFLGDGAPVRMLALARVEPADLDGIDRIVEPSPPPVRLGARLSEAFDAIAALPAAFQGRVPVADETGTVVGSLTADGVLAGLRRGAEAAETARVVEDAEAAKGGEHLTRRDSGSAVQRR
jgi:osmoprotectant transport system ATP-binding protein